MTRDITRVHTPPTIACVSRDEKPAALLWSGIIGILPMSLRDQHVREKIRAGHSGWNFGGSA